jgi:hypothetical protein
MSKLACTPFFWLQPILAALYCIEGGLEVNTRLAYLYRKLEKDWRLDITYCKVEGDCCEYLL